MLHKPMMSEFQNHTGRVIAAWFTQKSGDARKERAVFNVMSELGISYYLQGSKLQSPDPSFVLLQP